MSTLALGRAASLAYAVLTIYKVWAPPGALTVPDHQTTSASASTPTAKDGNESSNTNGSSTFTPKSSGFEGRLSSRSWKFLFLLGFITQTTTNVIVFQYFGGGWSTFSKQAFSWMDYMALGAMGLAWILRQSSYRALGKYFTYKVHVAKDQKLITTGPYSKLMHPGYAALVLQVVPFLYFIGLKNDLRVLALYTLTGAIPLSRRIVNEEKDLENHFGKKAFEEYRRTRWRIIPYIL